MLWKYKPLNSQQRSLTEVNLSFSPCVSFTSAQFVRWLKYQIYTENIVKNKSPVRCWSTWKYQLCYLFYFWSYKTAGNGNHVRLCCFSQSIYDSFLHQDYICRWPTQHISLISHFISAFSVQNTCSSSCTFLSISE